MDSDGLSRLLIVVGVVAIALGLLVRTGALGWFGNLPGDIRIESGRTRVFIPVTSMLIVSVGLSLLLSLLRR
ncbi:MAG TPA: DUF2905 domain-containing protein [Euzebyales bacterium]